MTTIDHGALLDALRPCKNALIIGHSHPDGDCVGTAAALAELLEAIGNKAAVLFPEPAPFRLQFLLQGRKELPALPADLENYDVIAVDVASLTQFGDIKEALSGKVALRIDHHDVGTPYTDVNFVDPTAAATGEILFDLWLHAKQVGAVEQLPAKAAYAAFGAISSDTGCFKYANVTSATHLRAAALLECGVNAAEINRLLFDTKDVNTIRAEEISYRNLRLFADGRIAVIAVDHEDYTDGLGIKDFETAIDIARSVRGVRLAAAIKAAPAKNTYRVSLRSTDDTDVASVAASFGGGGHLRAAGCTVYAANAEEVTKKILSALENCAEPTNCP